MTKTTTIYSATTINSLNQRQMNDTITSLTNDERIISDAYDFVNANKTDHQTNLINVSNFINEQLKDDLVSESPYETFEFELNDIATPRDIKESFLYTIKHDLVSYSWGICPSDLNKSAFGLLLEKSDYKCVKQVLHFDEVFSSEPIKDYAYVTDDSFESRLTPYSINSYDFNNIVTDTNNDLVSSSPYETSEFDLNSVIVDATIYQYDIVTSHTNTIFLDSRLSPKDLKLAPHTQVAKLVKKHGCICTVDGARIKAKKPVKIKATIDSYLAEQDLELLGDSKQFSSYKFGLGQDLKDLTDETFEAISILYAARSTMTAEKKYTDSVKEELKILQDKIFKINIKFLNKTKKNASKLDKKLEKIISKISKKLLEPTTSKISSQSSYLKSCMRIQDAETFKRDIASSMIYNEMKETESISDYFELLKSKKEMGV